MKWGEIDMRTLGNVLWHFPFLGFISATLTYLWGLILTATVVAAPIGLGLMEYSKFLFAPFGKEMIRKADLQIEENKHWKTYSTIVSILYLPLGLIMVVMAVFQIFFLCITIIGIPVAIVVAKSLSTYLNPVNKICVRHEVASELGRRAAESEVDQLSSSLSTTAGERATQPATLPPSSPPKSMTAKLSPEERSVTAAPTSRDSEPRSTPSPGKQDTDT